MRDTHIPQWYAFFTRTKHEKKVNENIRMAGFESFLPLRKTLNKWKDRKKWVESPLFPSYVFTKIPYNQRYAVLQIPSVVNIVGFCDQPCPVRPDEIEAIKALLASEATFEVMSGLTAGCRVRICSGPLEGLEAHVAQVRGSERVVINVSSIGKTIIINAQDYKIARL